MEKRGHVSPLRIAELNSRIFSRMIYCALHPLNFPSNFRNKKFKSPFLFFLYRFRVCYFILFLYYFISAPFCGARFSARDLTSRFAYECDENSSLRIFAPFCTFFLHFFLFVCVFAYMLGSIMARIQVISNETSRFQFSMVLL